MTECRYCTHAPADIDHIYLHADAWRQEARNAEHARRTMAAAQRELAVQLRGAARLLEEAQ